ncbi:MAG: alpha-glucan family phosphorylase [Endomicrobia bacterium]|nr:alpha-glucan family phosphorylase [Endomicrobiia bacterium]
MNNIKNREAEDIFKVENPRAFIVTPKLPEKLQPILEIAYNLWWVWNSEAFELFRRIDRDLWEEVYHNPIQLLGRIPREKLLELEKDESFLAHLQEVYTSLNEYIKTQPWFYREFNKEHHNCKIAYFSMEYGLTEAIPMYAGGLGVLAGDLFKSASDMGLPMVGIGLAYRYGYFKQHLTDDGWQQEEYDELHFFRLPIVRMSDGSKPLRLFIPLKKLVIVDGKITYVEEKIYFEPWEVKIGRNSLYLFSTDIPENTPENRSITYQLYGGDLETRIKQEILLGIGGAIFLKSMNISPTVWHLNEGHCAFVILERIRQLMKESNLNFEEAREFVSATTIFTTHTPVPAGIDVFPVDMMKRYFNGFCEDLGINFDDLMSLGRENAEDKNSGFSMAVFAIKNSNFVNGVSKLHGEIARQMWKNIYPELPLFEIPIKYITNGIHSNTWISNELATLFDRYIGPQWREEPENQTVWERIKEIPDAELWRSHERRRERLVAFVRRRLKQQLESAGAPRNEIEQAEEVLDPEVLTIGFARRFAEYKRGTLLFRDIQRLKKIVLNKEKPVQIIISGKAHPHDNIGKGLIKHIIQITKDPEIKGKIIFVEDYDMNVAHYLVQGCDVWLNLPRRPLEASGTSGMKAAVNGVLNVSVLDGWWCEAYDGNNGWAVGGGEEYNDHSLQDEIESRILYDILEKEVIPLFYSRGSGGLPKGWVRKMKDSMMSICPKFNSNRLIEEYTRQFYLLADNNYTIYSKDNFFITKSFTEWLKKVSRYWENIKVLEIVDNIAEVYNLGEKIVINTKIFTDKLLDRDISAQIYWGYLDSKGRIYQPKIKEMKLTDKESDNVFIYNGEIEADRIGHCGYVLRVLPKFGGEILYIPGLIKWLKISKNS